MKAVNDSASSPTSASYSANLIRRRSDNYRRRNLDMKGSPVPGERSTACRARIRRRVIRRLVRGKNFPQPIHLTPAEKQLISQTAQFNKVTTPKNRHEVQPHQAEGFPA
jgi:hypothetical protein